MNPVERFAAVLTRTCYRYSSWVRWIQWKGSPLFSQEPATGIRPELDESSGKVRRCAHENLLPVPVLSQMNPVQRFVPHLFQIDLISYIYSYVFRVIPSLKVSWSYFCLCMSHFSPVSFIWMRAQMPNVNRNLEILICTMLNLCTGVYLLLDSFFTNNWCSHGYDVNH